MGLIALVVLAATIGLFMINGGKSRARGIEKTEGRMDKLRKAPMEGRISKETHE